MLDGERRQHRRRRRVQPDPPGRGRPAEGGPQARRRPSRDAALRDPPREPAAAEAGRGRGRAGDAGLLPPARVDLRHGRLRRRPHPCRRGRRPRPDPVLGLAMTLPPDQVRAMFERITPAYDRMNRLMSLGMDGSWRALAVRASGVAPGDAALDVCCGTGDLAIELLDAVSTRGRVVGLDFSEAMLDAARRKSSQIEWVRGDALALPFGD